MLPSPVLSCIFEYFGIHDTSILGNVTSFVFVVVRIIQFNFHGLTSYSNVSFEKVLFSKSDGDSWNEKEMEACFKYFTRRN